MITEKELKWLEQLQSQHQFDLQNTRFCFESNQFFALQNNFNANEKNGEIEFFAFQNNTKTKVGFITYMAGKGYWYDNQVTLFKLEVDQNFQGNGLGTYGLSFLTEIAFAKRMTMIDGKYFPTTTMAEHVYHKNGFNIEREYYDTRIVRYIENADIKNIHQNTQDFNGIKVYNHHKKLYIEKFRTDAQQAL